MPELCVRMAWAQMDRLPAPGVASLLAAAGRPWLPPVEASFGAGAGRSPCPDY